MSVKTRSNRLLNMNLWDVDPTAPTPVEPAQPHGSLQAASFSCGKLCTRLFPQCPSSRPEALVSEKDTREHGTGSELWCGTRSSPETQVLAPPRLTSTDQVSQGPLVLTASLTVLKLHYTFLINPFHWVKGLVKKHNQHHSRALWKTKDRDSQCLSSQITHQHCSFWRWAPVIQKLLLGHDSVFLKCAHISQYMGKEHLKSIQEAPKLSLFPKLYPARIAVDSKDKRH